jgi:hypothetical protein
MPLREVSVARNEIEHVCATCERIAAGVPITRCVVTPASGALVGAGVGAGVGYQALSLACASCGSVECFNTDLSAADEDATSPGNHAARAEQARLVRALCRLAGLTNA